MGCLLRIHYKPIIDLIICLRGTTFVLSLWGLNIIRDPKRCAPEFPIIVYRVFAGILEEGILWLIGWWGVFTSVKDAGEKWQKMLWTKDTVCHSLRFRLLFHMFRLCIIEIAFAMRDSWMVRVRRTACKLMLWQKIEFIRIMKFTSDFSTTWAHKFNHPLLDFQLKQGCKLVCVMMHHIIVLDRKRFSSYLDASWLSLAHAK